MIRTIRHASAVIFLFIAALFILTNSRTDTLAATKSVKVNFNSSGGSSVPSKTVTYNKTLSAPTAPKKTGHTFAGWYKDSKYKSAWNFKTDKVTKTITLYAKWNINTYKVTFNSMGGSSVSPQNIKYQGLVKNPTTPIRVGYSFVGWYKDSKYKSAWKFTSLRVTGNITLYAKWSAQKARKVTFNSNGGTKLATKSVSYNSLLSLPAPTKTGYTFSGWYKDSKLKTLWNKSTNRVTSDITLYAKWTPIKFTIKFDTQGGNTITAKTVSYDSLLPSLSAPTKNGYTFVGWYTASNLLTPWKATNKIHANITLYAKWKVTSEVEYTAIIPYYIEALNVRSLPSTTGVKLGALKSNTVINVRTCKDPGWYQINYDGKEAYISKTLMDVDLTPSVQLITYASYITSTSGASIYQSPSPSSKIVGTIKNGAYVNVQPIPGNTDFVLTTYSGGKIGYLPVSNIQRLFYNTLNIHSPSPVTATQINNAVSAYMSRNKVSSSALKNQGQTFIDVGKASGINPLILAAIAIHESGWGTNSLSLKKNNIFSIGAFDDAPYDSAYTFQLVKEAVQYEANLLNQYYLNSAFSNRMYAAGDFLGTGGLDGLIFKEKRVGTSGINQYYSTDVNWGADIASICQAILPYDAAYYNKSTPMTAKSLNNLNLKTVDYNLSALSITGKNRGKSLPLFTSLGGSTTVTDASNNPISLSTYNSNGASGTFTVLHLYGNLWSGWMQISIPNTKYTGYVNFGGLSNYSNRFTLDNLMRNTASGNYARQTNLNVLPTGYTPCYR